MRLRERRVRRQGGLVRRDGCLHVSGIGELDGALQQGAGIAAERRDRGEDGIGDGRPACAELRVTLQRRARLVAASERAVGQRQRVMGRAEFGK